MVIIQGLMGLYMQFIMEELPVHQDRYPFRRVMYCISMLVDMEGKECSQLFQAAIMVVEMLTEVVHGLLRAAVEPQM